MSHSSRGAHTQRRILHTVSLFAMLTAAPLLAPATAHAFPGSDMAQTAGSQQQPILAATGHRGGGNSDPATADARGFIASMGQQALGFLRDQKLGQSGKEEAFRNLLQSNFDMAAIGRFTAGQYWRQMSPQQQQQYQNLFRDYVVSVYSARFNQYSNQQFNVTGSTPAETPTDTLVNSTITSEQTQPVNVDWRVRNENGRNMIVDVLVEGVSMSQTQRSDFASVIQRGGGNVQVLIDQLAHQAGHQ